tara:strand:+ start:18 stop:758 length:741 start_codon:yes stop_codon:yes gene_type:complete
MTDLYHVSKGNDKTGCFSFDLPAKITCPGMTSACGSKCYAASMMRVYKGVAAKYARNLELANSDDFVMRMVRDIPPRCEFRIHVSGDFYSTEYVDKWIEIAKRRTDVILYTYTRSWVIPDIWLRIRELNNLLNVNVNLSVDDDTGRPIARDDFRWCYLTHDDNAPNWLRKGDIAFRSNATGKKGNHKWKRKDAIEKGNDPDLVAPLVHKLGKATVCPFERGTDMPKNFSCAKCHLCVDKPKVLSFA